MTTTKHIHHDAIIEWAKGATIQCRLSDDDTWDIVDPPLWKPQYQYRVKPVTKKYRVALFKWKTGETSAACASTEYDEKRYEGFAHFVRWLTDWIEYEV